MKKYWQYRKIYQRSAEEIQAIRLHLLFGDDMTGKLILPENSIYSADSTQDTIYRMGAITKPITQELPEISNISKT